MLRIVDSLANRTVLATQLPVLVEMRLAFLTVSLTPTRVVRWLSFEIVFVEAPFSLFCLLESLF